MTSWLAKWLAGVGLMFVVHGLGPPTDAGEIFMGSLIMLVFGAMGISLARKVNIEE
jgi:hypothetical protein